MLQFVDEHANAIGAIGSVSSAIVAIVAALIAAVAVRYSKALLEENQIMRLAGSDPEVVIYLKPDHQISNCLNIIIENLGNGPAFDVQFSVNIEDNVIEKKSIIFSKQIGSIPFTVLSPGNPIITSFGMGFNLLASPQLPEFDAKTTYKNVRGVEISKIYKINVKSFEGVGTFSPESNLKNIEKNLAAISGSLNKIAQS